MKTLDFIVENQDILSEQMDKIIGGQYDQVSDECKNDGIIYRCTDGTTEPTLNAGVAFSIF
ncbi:hypothetical protein [Proteiniphilum sp. X52]|uniref:hypothetical protein n=1 Tax=Proteiniphilum sp. X52 TaxID=2382159 RepID=UPI000F0A2BBF|nr:hypothetical protein [Proteiniphilum sp. X52]RNC63504.1 hypothetical protein D7D25_15950 [Proteiniphilum sp. X52]